MNSPLRCRWDELLGNLKAQSKVLVAFSGGCDSTFLLAAARFVLPKTNILAVTAVSASLPEREYFRAKTLAQKLDVPHVFKSTHEINNPSYAANPSNRCFFCKDELFAQLYPLAQDKKMRLADGLNFSDLNEYRPGVQAAQKWNVIHPLVEARLTKRDIRLLSRWRKLPTWNKPASPCLSSRIPYGTPVTPAVLRRIEKAERVLQDEQFSIVRVRHFGAQARIEVPLSDFPRLQETKMWATIVEQLKKVGYSEIILDPRGFRSGQLNETRERPPFSYSEPRVGGN